MGLFQKFKLFNKAEETNTLYRLIGGSQFGGQPIEKGKEPKIGSIVSGVFATPHKSAIDAMIEYCVEQGEDEITGMSIKESDLRILLLSNAKVRKPTSHEKFMDWEDSDKDEVMIEYAKIEKVLTVQEWNKINK